MKRLVLGVLGGVLLSSCQALKDHYDLWFVVPKPPPLEGTLEWRSR